MAKKIFTTIEITDYHIKFIQSSPLRTKNAVSCCEVVSIDGLTDDGVLKELQKITSTKSISIDELTVIIPRRFVILKQISLPSHNEEEIKKMLRLQLVGQIPYALEDVVYDFQLISKDASGYSRVLALVVHKEVSERYVKGLHKIGISLTKLELSSFGILRWWVRQEAINKVKKKQAVVVLNIDTVQSEICFCHENNLLFSRNINYGSRDLYSHGIDQIVNQVQLSIKAYENENMGPALQKVIVVSSMPEAGTLKGKLETEIPFLVDVLTAYENIFVQKKVNLLSLKDQRGLSLTVGLGFHFMSMGKTFNLAPTEVHDTKKMKLKKKSLVKLVFFMGLAFALFCSDYFITIVSKNNQLKSLEEKNRVLASQVKSAKQKIEFVNSFTKQVNNWVFFPDLMDELYRLVPKGVSLRMLGLNETQQLVIQGYALSGSDVNTFQQSLLASKVFDDINLQFATKRRIFNYGITDFKIVGQLEQKDVLEND